MTSPLKQFTQPAKRMNLKPLDKSKGILDDHAVRKNVATQEGTIEKVPVNDNDIVNKAYVDSSDGTHRPPFLEIQNPTSTEEYLIGFTGTKAITITKIWAETDTGTVDFNIEQRVFGSGESSGTNVMSSDLQADDNGATQTSFADATVPAGYWLVYSASAVASSPTNIKVGYEYTID